MVAVAKERALLEIVLYEQVENGDLVTYEYKLSGHFTNAGALGSAEGTIVQVGLFTKYLPPFLLKS